MGCYWIVVGMGDDLCMAEVQVWADGLAELGALIGRRFSRSEARERVVEYLRGLLSAEERKNSWTLSERAGEATADGMQRLLSTSDWDPDLVRDDLQRYVVDHLADPGGVLVVDETGFLKKGTRSAGVASPARSDSVQEFLRSSSESNPRRYSTTRSRGSDLEKRRPIRAPNSANPSAQTCTSAMHRSSPIPTTIQ